MCEQVSHPAHPPQLDGKHSMMKNVFEFIGHGGKRLWGFSPKLEDFCR